MYSTNYGINMKETKDLSRNCLIDGKTFHETYMLTDEQVEFHVDNIVRITEEISKNYNGVTILTGSNGSGKSLVRKQLQIHLKRQDVRIAHASMELRTTNYGTTMGALGGMFNDLSWLATSSTTLHLIDGIIENYTEQYIVIDEPEIGMSHMMAKAISKKLYNFVKNRIDENQKGLMIVTHNVDILKTFVDGDLDFSFVNLNGFSMEEYMDSFENPPDYDFDLQKFSEDKRIFLNVRDRMNDQKNQ